MTKSKNRYKYVFFIDASSAASIKTDLQSAIRSLGGVHSQATFEDALQFLAQPDNCDWLVIFDNADDPKLPLPKYLPRCDHGTSIITGRNPDLTRLSPTSHWHLTGMIEASAMGVLLRAAQRQDAGDQEESNNGLEICKVLGGLPLALVQVGCYCHTLTISFTQYLRRLKQHRAKLLKIEPSLQLDGYTYSVYASIGLSYSLLDGPARSLLHLLAFFHPSSIRLDILRIAEKYGFKTNKEWFPRDEQFDRRLEKLRELLAPNGKWDDTYIDGLLNKLQSFSLISLSSSDDNTSITIHPLIQSFAQDTLSPADYSHYVQMTVYTLDGCNRYETASIFRYLPVHITEIESSQVELHINDVVSFAHILRCTGFLEDSIKNGTK